MNHEATASDPRVGGLVRETVEQFEVGDSTVTMIADPETRDAWIQSDVATEVEA